MITITHFPNKKFYVAKAQKVPKLRILTISGEKLSKTISNKFTGERNSKESASAHKLLSHAED